MRCGGESTEKPGQWRARVPARGTPTMTRTGLPSRVMVGVPLPWLLHRFASASHSPTKSQGPLNPPAPHSPLRISRPSFSCSLTSQVLSAPGPSGPLSIHPYIDALYVPVYVRPPDCDTTYDLRAQYTTALYLCCTSTAHLRMPAQNLSNTCDLPNLQQKASMPCLYPARGPAGAAL